MNINSAINKASKILRNKFISNSQLDAEILMAKTINKDRRYILLNHNNSLNKDQLKNFYELIEQRSLIIKDINDFFLYNVNQNSLIRSIERRFG